MDQESNKKQNDEIDLKALFRSIGDFFISVFYGVIGLIISFRRLTLRYLKVMIIILSVSIGIGVFLKYKATPFYESEMIIRSPYLDVGISNTVFDKLNSLCEEGNYETLSKILKLKLEDAEKLKGIKASPFLSEQEVISFEVFKDRLNQLVKDNEDVERVVERLQYQNRSTYKIMVQVFDPEVISRLEKPLVDYLQNTDFVKKRLEITEQIRESKKAKLETELLKIDTLREVIQRSLVANIERRDRGSNNIFMGETGSITNPLEIVRETIRRYDDLMSIERDLFLRPDFEVIDSFISFEKPAGMRLRDVIIYSILIGLAISYAFIFLREINLYLDRMETRRQEN